ncbi:hypothetical protein C6503_19530 [Candidatus Poribacteria bacterium]|nr:MAG: hypothetical protein C6503_19530 [Candidatus Poribacteria bacterium]
MGTKKKVNLAEVFQKNEQLQKPELEVVEAAPTEKKKVAPSREKKKHIGGYFDEAVYRQMKHLGVEKNMTTQDILKEALNAFFRLHDKPPIA